MTTHDFKWLFLIRFGFYLPYIHVLGHQYTFSRNRLNSFNLETLIKHDACCFWHGADMVLTWCWHGADMVLTWCWHGTDMVLTWYWHGADMVLTWCWHGADMVLTWCWHGADMVLTWCWHGTDMVLTWCWHGTWHHYILKEQSVQDVQLSSQLSHWKLTAKKYVLWNIYILACVN
jgi:hypothetical protein